MKALINRLIAAGIRRHERALRIRRLKGEIYSCLDTLGEGLNKNDPEKVGLALRTLGAVAISADPYYLLNVRRPTREYPRPDTCRWHQ